MRLPLIALLIWLVSRILIVQFAATYISDTEWYHYIAMKHVWGTEKLYKDVEFAYPALSLPFVLGPAYLSEHLSFETYHHIFRWSMFSLELISVLMLFYFGFYRMGLSPKRVAASILLVTLFGLLQCHLIYDRMDVGVGLLMLGALLLWRKSWKAQTVWACLGNLFKIIPAMFFAFPLTEYLVNKFKSWPQRILFFVLSFIPILGVPLILDKLFFPGMAASLSEHLKRGIQIESIWASPFMLWRASKSGAEIDVGRYFGAHEIAGESLPYAYVLMSKIFGFVILAILGLCFLRFVLRKKSSTLLQLQTAFAFILVFLASQRVLSPQFFIWLIPIVSLWLVVGKKPVQTAAFILLYVLTYVSFDIGYVEIINFNFTYVMILTLRNLLLVVIAAYAVAQYIKSTKPSD
jgi:hypothetical protein